MITKTAFLGALAAGAGRGLLKLVKPSAAWKAMSVPQKALSLGKTTAVSAGMSAGIQALKENGQEQVGG